MTIPLPLGGGLYLGWALGANDAANVFGTAVASRIISYRRASILCGGAVILGAFVQGQAGIKTLSGLVAQDVNTLVVTSLAAAVREKMLSIAHQLHKTGSGLQAPSANAGEQLRVADPFG